MLRFYLRHSPDGHFLDLDPYLLKGGYSRSITIAAEDDLNNFRGSQVQLTLVDRAGIFTTGAHTLTGEEEIVLSRAEFHSRSEIESKALWSGTVDKSYIEKKPDTDDLIIRVLQNGSLLNTIEAGLPDWYYDTDTGELVTNPDNLDRYKGSADNWVRLTNPDGTFGHNQVDTENNEIIYTPSARDRLTDELYKSKFQAVFRHFHTANKNIGGVEWPFPNVIQSGVENGRALWTGQFQQHYHPDFDRNPDQWINTDGALAQDYGAYLRNPEPSLNFFRQPVSTLIAELVSQYNRQARFPIAFDPESDCIVQAPVINLQIEILNRQPDVEFIDLQFYPETPTSPERTLAIVNWKNAEAGDSTLRFSVYEIVNETELNPIAERVEVEGIGGAADAAVWSTFKRGMRFARTSVPVAGNNVAFLYWMSSGSRPNPNRPNSYTRFFSCYNFHIQLGGNTPTLYGPFNNVVYEHEGEFPSDPPGGVVNRSATISTTGAFFVRQAVAPFEPLPPESDPQFSATVNNRIYNARQGGLTVSGALFDRVGVDAENTKLAAILSELAKLTYSRWFITPQRRLKFISRQVPGNTVAIKPSRTLPEFKTFTRKLDRLDIAEFGSALVLPDNFKQAHKNWQQENVIGKTVQGFEVGVPLEDLVAFPTIGDRLDFPDPNLPPVYDPDLRIKYGKHLFEKAELDLDNEVVQLTAALPTL